MDYINQDFEVEKVDLWINTTSKVMVEKNTISYKTLDFKNLPQTFVCWWWQTELELYFYAYKLMMFVVLETSTQTEQAIKQIE